MTNEQIIKEITADVFGISPKEIEVVERLMGGMSNYTYVIQIKDKKYTFRIPGKNAERFVDRETEQDNINLVNQLNLNNQTLFLDVESGYKIAEYIEDFLRILGLFFSRTWKPVNLWVGPCRERVWQVPQG